LNPVQDVLDKDAVNPAVRGMVVCWDGPVATGSATLGIESRKVFHAAAGFQVSIIKPVDEA
jgi:hypothetical protein